MEFSDECNIDEDVTKKLSDIKIWLLTALNNLTTDTTSSNTHGDYCVSMMRDVIITVEIKKKTFPNSK